MERVEFIQFQGKQILLEDISHLGPGEDFVNTIESAKKIIRSQPEKSVLALLDASNVHFNSEMLGIISEFAKGNTPYIKSATVVGIEGLLKIVLSTISKAAGRDFHVFPTREEAIDYLIKQ